MLQEASNFVGVALIQRRLENLLTMKKIQSMKMGKMMVLPITVLL